MARVIRLLPGGYVDETGPHRGHPFTPWWFMHREIFRENRMTGVELIAAERQRQIDVEGWTPEHDDTHIHSEMLWAGICYAKYASGVLYAEKAGLTPPSLRVSDSWRWSAEWWKPSEDPIRNLEKAGALLAAEIDRLQRAKESNVIATITTPITDEIRSVLSGAESTNCVHLSEIGEVKEDDIKSLKSNSTLKFDHWSIPKEGK